MADGNLEFFRSGNAPNASFTGDAGGEKNTNGHHNDRTNDVSRGNSRKVMRLPEKKSLLQEARISLDPTMLTICTVPYNMMQDENGIYMSQRVRQINEVIREVQMNRVNL